MAAPVRNEYRYSLKKLEFDVKHNKSPPVKSSIDEAPKLELKALPPHLMYVLFGREVHFSSITTADLKERQVIGPVAVLKRFKRVTGWTIVNIIGIPLVFVPINTTNAVSQPKY